MERNLHPVSETDSVWREDEVSLSVGTLRFEVSYLHCVGTLYFVHFTESSALGRKFRDL